MTGFSTFAGARRHDEQGDKLRVRAELFADHYSQARLFWKSLTDNERAHVASSFMFELSKVQLEQVPAAHDRQSSECRRGTGGAGRRWDGARASEEESGARARSIDMKPSPALSIQRNMKATLNGRVVGILVADGSDVEEVTAVAEGRRKGRWTVQ